MATVTALTAARMLLIEAGSVVSGTINGAGHLILTKHDGSTIDAGPVIGPQGNPGPTGPASPTLVTSTTRPTTPAVGTFIYETDTKKGFVWNGTIWVPTGWAPHCKIVKSTFSGDPTIATSSWTAFPFDAEDLDSDNMHDLVTNPDRITFKTPGVYSIGARLSFAGGGTGGGIRTLAIALNDAAGTFPVASRIAVDTKEASNPAVAESILQVSVIQRFAANDFIRAGLFQNSGAGINSIGTQSGSQSGAYPRMWATFLSP